MTPIRVYTLFVTTADIPCALFNLRRASRAISQLYDEILRPSGLRGTQYTVLRYLDGRGPMTVSELGEQLGMDRTTATRNLRVLEREDRIASEPGSDRRTRVVRITPKGRGALRKAHPLWEKAQSTVVGSLGESRWEDLRRELERVNAISHEALTERG